MMPCLTQIGRVLILCRATQSFSAVMCKKPVHWETANCLKWLKASDIAIDSEGAIKLIANSNLGDNPGKIKTSMVSLDFQPIILIVILKRLTNYPCQKSLEMYIQMMYN
jgi:hypothetical protein